MGVQVVGAADGALVRGLWMERRWWGRWQGAGGAQVGGHGWSAGGGARMERRWRGAGGAQVAGRGWSAGGGARMERRWRGAGGAQVARMLVG